MGAGAFRAGSSRLREAVAPRSFVRSSAAREPRLRISLSFFSSGVSTLLQRLPIVRLSSSDSSG